MIPKGKFSTQHVNIAVLSGIPLIAFFRQQKSNIWAWPKTELVNLIIAVSQPTLDPVRPINHLSVTYLFSKSGLYVPSCLSNVDAGC